MIPFFAYDMQDAAALTVVATCVVWGYFRFFKRKGGPGCSACPSTKPPQAAAPAEPQKHTISAVLLEQTAKDFKPKADKQKNTH